MKRAIQFMGMSCLTICLMSLVYSQDVTSSNDADAVQALRGVSTVPTSLIPPGSSVPKTPGSGQPIVTTLVDSVLLANPGPANNGGSTAWAMFFNLIAGPFPVNVTRMTTASTAAASASYSVEVFTRTGNALGGPVGSGPGSSSAGWTSIGTAPVTQGATASGVSLLFTIPTIHINARDTVGVAIRFTGAGPRYFGTGTPPYETYTNADLTLITGDGRSAPFTTTGSWFASRALVGELHYSVVTVGVEPGGGIPSAFTLSQNYPNPFNPSTTIRFNLPVMSHTSLTVYDVLGREIAIILNGEVARGTHDVMWNGTNNTGANVTSGVYVYELKSGNYVSTKKMLLMK